MERDNAEVWLGLRDILIVAAAGCCIDGEVETLAFMPFP